MTTYIEKQIHRKNEPAVFHAVHIQPARQIQQTKMPVRHSGIRQISFRVFPLRKEYRHPDPATGQADDFPAGAGHHLAPDGTELVYSPGHQKDRLLP